MANKFKTYLRDYKSILAATGLIDFGCEFVNDGTTTGCFCRQGREECCCENCAVSYGYFPTYAYGNKRVLASPKMINTYNRLFDTNSGFWRPDKGCILPRKYRSMTCVFFNCLDQKGEKDRKTADIIDGMQGAAQRFSGLMIEILEDWKKITKIG
jgi:hypothetical protein